MVYNVSYNNISAIFTASYKYNESQNKRIAKLGGDVGCRVWEHAAGMQLLSTEMLSSL
jgi:hypothetical protein